MEGQEVVILNRIYPPAQGITGESASELAEYLLGKGVQVHVIHVDAPYNGGSDHVKQAGNVHKISTFYNGKAKLLRLLANIYEGYSLVRRAKKMGADITICMTDPPLMNLWAALLLGKKHKWFLWSMDLYPEAFIAGRLVSQKNVFYRAIENIILKRPPSYLITLGKYQAESLRAKYGKPLDYTILPCGIFDKQRLNGKASIVPVWAADRNKIYLGYCGNLGEAHSIDFLFSVIDNFDSDKFSLILAVYGTYAARVIEYARSKKGVTIVESVSRAELHYIDVHLASLMQEWVNVSVPSKTVSSVCAGSAFLYHGVKDSDNWNLLNGAGWIIDGEDIDQQVKSFLLNLDEETVMEKKAEAKKLASSLNTMKRQAFEKILDKIASLNPN